MNVIGDEFENYSTQSFWRSALQRFYSYIKSLKLRLLIDGVDVHQLIDYNQSLDIHDKLSVITLFLKRVASISVTFCEQSFSIFEDHLVETIHHDHHDDQPIG